MGAASVRSGWLALLTGACTLLASCGGGGGGGSESPTQPTPTANVSITAVGPSDLVPSGFGVRTHIIVTLSNTGTAAATTVVLNARLPSSLTLTHVDCKATAPAVCPALNQETYSTDTLPPGGSLTFDLEMWPFAATSGPQSSTFTVSANNNAVKGGVSATATVNTYTADVGVSTTASAASVPAGGAITYTTTVVNLGPDAARRVVVNNWPDQGQEIGQVTCLASGGAVCPDTLGARVEVPLLPVGASLQFIVPATVGPLTSGPIFHRARVSAPGDSNQFNDSATVAANAVYVPPAGATAVSIQSDAGDYIGQGQSHVYTQANAVVSVEPVANKLRVTIDGEQKWTGDFALPNTFTQLQPGSYANLTRYAFADPAVGGLDWYGEARGCNTVSGSIVVNSAAYVAGQLSTLDMNFEQHCENGATALRGQIRWNRADSTAASGPRTPIPPSLWSPDAGAVPSSGSYVYLQSDPTDFVGQGGYYLTTRTYSYAKSNAAIAVTVQDGLLMVNVDGNERWSGEFRVMNSLAAPNVGYYGGLLRFPFHNPTAGGMDWGGEGRGCNELNGWFAIDGITIVNGTVSTLDLRFEQHCEKGAAAMRGKIHWDASDPTTPAGPVQPPPASLWSPAAGATPSTGNYIYLQSDPGDFVGAGVTATYTPANANITLQTISQTTGAVFGITITGQNITQTGYFKSMGTLSQLQPGYYGNLQRYGFNNPAIGGMEWFGDGRACGLLNAWFVIDDIVYTAGVITSIDLRFEQHCSDNYPALHGKIHWRAQ